MVDLVEKGPGTRDRRHLIGMVPLRWVALLLYLVLLVGAHECASGDGGSCPPVELAEVY